MSDSGLTITLVAASSLAEDSGADRMKVTLCGNQLVGMLNIICSLNFDTSAMFHSNFDDFLMSLAQRKKRSLSEEPEAYYRDYNRYNI